MTARQLNEIIDRTEEGEWTLNDAAVREMKRYHLRQEEGENWDVEASESLDVVDRENWDGDAATEAMMEMGAGAVRRGNLFVRTDDEADIANVKAHSKFPIADVVDGELVAITAGIESADSFLQPGEVEGVSDTDIEEAQRIIDEYRRSSDDLRDPDEGESSHDPQEVRTGDRVIRDVATNVRQPEGDDSEPGDLIVFEIPDRQLDRHGTRIRPEGIDFENFKRNPVVLFSHGHETKLPVGRAQNIHVRGGSMFAEVEFDQEDQFAREVERKIRDGFLNAASLGFIVKDSQERNGERVIEESEMVELSVVAVPSNPDALVAQRDGLETRLQEIEYKLSKLQSHIEAKSASSSTDEGGDQGQRDPSPTQEGDDQADDEIDYQRLASAVTRKVKEQTLEPLIRRVVKRKLGKA